MSRLALDEAQVTNADLLRHTRPSRLGLEGVVFQDLDSVDYAQDASHMLGDGNCQLPQVIRANAATKLDLTTTSADYEAGEFGPL